MSTFEVNEDTILHLLELKNVYLSGEFSVEKKEVEDKCLKAGAHKQNRPTMKTDYIVVGDRMPLIDKIRVPFIWLISRRTHLVSEQEIYDLIKQK